MPTWTCLEGRVASHRDSTSSRWRPRREINSLHSGPSSLLPIHQKLPSVCAFFITRVNICHVNKARGCFSHLRNRICKDTAPLMFLSQYNMYPSEDESRPVRAGLRRQARGWSGAGGGCSRCLWKRRGEAGSRDVQRLRGHAEAEQGTEPGSWAKGGSGGQLQGQLPASGRTVIREKEAPFSQGCVRHAGPRRCVCSVAETHTGFRHQQ